MGILMVSPVALFFLSPLEVPAAVAGTDNTKLDIFDQIQTA